jgi:hypothetical protein
MVPSISHSREEETPEAKARWFQSLSPQERMNLFSEWMEIVFQNNPRIADHKDAEAIAKGFRILSKS